jgi:glycosyltransferase involved in cell wall biosynthesis
MLRTLGLPRVSVIGHVRELRPTPRTWKDRDGMLFVGAVHAVDSPNYDSLLWFIDEVLPLVEKQLHWRTHITVAGYVAPRLDLSRIPHHERVSFLGAVSDLEPLFDRHRVFIAPTRFASGIPYKVHTAASYGVPVVATELLRRQLGWVRGSEILTAEASDPAGFATEVVALHESELLWRSIRDAALARLRVENNREQYIAALMSVLDQQA